MPYPKGVRNKQTGAPADLIDGQALAQIFRQTAQLLEQNEQLLNDLNVFPVPDSDTGTNSLLTIQSGLVHLDKGKKDAAAVANYMATDAGHNARGNSGVILAEFLRGFAHVATSDLDTTALHACLANAAQAAQAAVAAPREGTMLTVAQAASDVQVNDSLSEYVENLSRVSRQAVHDSTSQLDVLQAAGVVDAGALALSLFFDAIHEVVNNKKLKVIGLAQTACNVQAIEYHGPDFEVMFNFVGDALSLREELAVMGESLTVTGPATQARFHIHVDNPTEAILEAMRHGMASRIVITQLTSQVDEQSSADGIAVVIALDGPGLTAQAIDLGAVCINAASDPSISEIEAAVRATGQRNVILLPSAIDNHAAAAIASHNLRADGIKVKVIPTRTVPHSLAALAVFDSASNVSANIESMTRAVESTHSGCVLVTDAGNVQGYVDGNLFESSAATSANDMLVHVVDELLKAGGELVTIVVGNDGQSNQHVSLLADNVDVEFEFIDGGQSTSTYLIGVE